VTTASHRLLKATVFAAAIFALVVVFGVAVTRAANSVLTFMEFHRDDAGSVDWLGQVQSIMVSSDGKYL